MSSRPARRARLAWRRSWARPLLAWQPMPSGGLSLLHPDGTDELHSPAGELLLRREALHAQAARDAAAAAPRPGGGWLIADEDRLVALDAEGQERWRLPVGGAPVLACGRSRIAVAAAWQQVRVLNARGQELRRIEGGPVRPRLAFVGPSDALLVAASSGHVLLARGDGAKMAGLSLGSHVVSASGARAPMAVVVTRGAGAHLIDGEGRERGVVDPGVPLASAWLSADAAWLLLHAIDRTLHLVELPSGDRTWWSRREEPLLGAAVDASGFTLVGADGTVERWWHEIDDSARRAGDGLLAGPVAVSLRELTALRDVPDGIDRVAVSRDGRHVAVADIRAGSVCLLGATHDRERVLRGVDQPATILFGAESCTMLVSGPRSANLVELAERGRTWQLRGAFRSIAVAAGRLVAATNASRPRLIDYRVDGAYGEWTLPGGAAEGLALPDHGSEVAVLGADGRLRLFAEGAVAWSVSAESGARCRFDSAGLVLVDASGWARRLRLSDGAIEGVWRLPACTELLRVGGRLAVRVSPSDVRLLDEDSPEPPQLGGPSDTPAWPFESEEGPAVLRLEGRGLRAVTASGSLLFHCRLPVAVEPWRIAVGGRLAAIACGDRVGLLKLGEPSPALAGERSRLLEPKP